MSGIEKKPLIHLSDVNVRYGMRTTLADVNLTVHRGDFLAITGPNGGGKTTLLRVMLKLLKPTSGQVTYFNDAGIKQDRLRIGYLPQKNSIDSRFPLTVREVVELGLTDNMDKYERRQRVGEMIDLVGLSTHSDDNLGSLSGGQLQRTLLARAIVSRPEILVLDEPLSYLDKHYEGMVYGLLEEMAKNTTIIMVSHDVSKVAQMANSHIIVDGRVEFCSSSSHFMHYDCCDEPGHGRH